MRQEQEPTLASDGRDGTVSSHPAFGMIGASRVQGSTTLNGSDFVHHNFINVSIRHSELHRDLSHDWHFGREEIVEVALSEAQWATFVSSLNHGNGVACTIEHLHGKVMPSIPLRRNEEVTRQEFAESVGSIKTLLDNAEKAIRDDLGASFSERKKQAVLAHLTQLRRELTDSVPFMSKSFDKHMEQTVEKAKVEVNAYMESVVSRAGFDALTGTTMPLQLTDGTK